MPIREIKTLLINTLSTKIGKLSKKLQKIKQNLLAVPCWGDTPNDKI